MMIISSGDYLTLAARTTSVTSYPIRFVIEAKLELKYLWQKLLKNRTISMWREPQKNRATIMHKMFKTDRLKAQ